MSVVLEHTVNTTNRPQQEFPQKVNKDVVAGHVGHIAVKKHSTLDTVHRSVYVSTKDKGSRIRKGGRK